MKILHYLFEIPIIIIAVWGIYNIEIRDNHIILCLWPSDSEVHADTKLTLVCFILYGFIWGKIHSWFAYSSVRKELRAQRKANKNLNKEQEKLNETVSGLKQNIKLMEQAKANEPAESGKSNPLSGALKGFSAALKKQFSNNKGAE